MTTVPGLTVEPRERADGARLRLAGELDIATVALLESAVQQVLDDGTRDLVIDMRELAFIDSSGLRLCILLGDRARSEGWSLVLVRPGEPAASVFRLTGAEENLPFVDEVAEP